MSEVQEDRERGRERALEGGWKKCRSIALPGSHGYHAGDCEGRGTALRSHSGYLCYQRGPATPLNQSI
jgi:hypothetical protein